MADIVVVQKLGTDHPQTGTASGVGVVRQAGAFGNLVRDVPAGEVVSKTEVSDVIEGTGDEVGVHISVEHVCENVIASQVAPVDEPATLATAVDPRERQNVLRQAGTVRGLVRQVVRRIRRDGERIGSSRVHDVGLTSVGEATHRVDDVVITAGVGTAEECTEYAAR